MGDAEKVPSGNSTYFMKLRLAKKEVKFCVPVCKLGPHENCTATSGYAAIVGVSGLDVVNDIMVSLICVVIHKVSSSPRTVRS